jgi:hypothetical protein
MPDENGKLTQEDGEDMTTQYFQGYVVGKLEDLCESDRGQWTEINKLKDKKGGVVDKMLSFLGGVAGGILAVITIGKLGGK